MLAAIWLVLGIAVVALQLALVAGERRTLGLRAADEGRARAAALGAYAITRAKLEYALRLRSPAEGPASNAARMRASDPWLDVDSLYSGTVDVDSVPVDVKVEDLGTRLNINTLSEVELKTFLSYVLGDFVEADYLAQTIADWRDEDELSRLHGGERDDYIKAGLLVLPSNGPFREVEELLDVKGMTAEAFALIRPYLTTRGSALVNLNSAPAPVLRALPGMNDDILARILAMRSRGQRITSVAEVMPQARGGAQVRQAMAAFNAQVQQGLAARAAVQATQIQLTVTAQPSPSARPLRFVVILARAQNQGGPVADPQWRVWP
jgi:general secretion pathway protein K